MTAETLRERYADLKEAEQTQLCFNAAYIHALLTHGLGFDDSEPGQIDFVHDNNKGAVDWALGALIWELNRTPPQVKCTHSAAEKQQLIDSVI